MDFATIVTSFSVGLLATVSPCVLPLYPGFLAYLAARGGETGRGLGRYLLGLLVLLGVLVMMLGLGALIALLSVSIGSALAYALPLADGLLIVLGVLLLLGRNPFARLGQLRSPLLSNPYVGAFVYGLMYGPLTLPCSGPLVVSIFALSFSRGEALGQLAAFLWFGLGFGLPLLVLSLLSGAAQRAITRTLAKHATWVNRVAGALLIGIGVYDIVLNWELLQSYWA